MKDTYSRKVKSNNGFSLAEVIAALTIGAMILVAVLGVYSRAEKSSSAVERSLDRTRLPREVLQRIAEDIDRIIAPVSDSKVADTKLTIANKFANLYPSAQLKITRSYYDNKEKKQLFEEIIWQSSYDYDANGLILYRSHKGIGVEDKLLDEEKEDWEKELFVPICSGVTFFSVQVPKDEEFLDSWTGVSLPHGIAATISFAEPFKKIDGNLDVPEDKKVTRTIAIDRTRKIKFTIVPVDSNEEPDEPGKERR